VLTYTTSVCIDFGAFDEFSEFGENVWETDHLGDGLLDDAGRAFE